MMRFTAILMIGAAPAASHAAASVTLASDVFVEHVARDEKGRPVATLVPPRAVAPGDRLVFVLSYRNGGGKPAAGLVITNPVPDSVAFAGADGAEVSVDGGRSWGALESLVVTGRDGRTRPAAPTDVTHVRWAVRETLAAGATGKLSYRAVAR